MNDPWQILILDRHTATEKDVKAAYARLLKQHRPDTDPEGFRRVREAYEAALDWLRNRISSLPEVSYAAGTGAEGDKDAAGKGNRLDLPVVFEDFPLPTDARDALATVETAAQSGNVEQLEAALMTFHDRCEAGGVSGASRATALERAFHGKVNDLAGAVTNSFLIRMAELGQTNLSHLVVSAWQEADDRGRLVQFSRALLENVQKLGTPDGAVLLARVGMLTGLEQPEMASTLANAAYPYLPVDARQHLMEKLEQEAALGKLFAEVSPSMKPFWFQRLRQENEGYDWNSPEARKALNDVIDRNRYSWQGWGIVKHLLPAPNWALVEHRLNNQVQQVAASQPRKSGFPGWAVFVAIMVIMNMMRFMATDKPPTTQKDIESIRDRLSAQAKDAPWDKPEMSAEEKKQQAQRVLDAFFPNGKAPVVDKPAPTPSTVPAPQTAPQIPGGLPGLTPAPQNAPTYQPPSRPSILQQ
ncbi:MAG TPA: hypothetical protein VLE43_07150 [Candidatus Saccharimonadia bacterium]|nr:hypothetical protein [Candidatus Saccharimonadia bacterium]